MRGDLARVINGIRSLEELKGYEDEAKRRGIHPMEIKLIAQRRADLEKPQKRRKRR